MRQAPLRLAFWMAMLLLGGACGSTANPAQEATRRKESLATAAPELGGADATVDPTNAMAALPSRSTPKPRDQQNGTSISAPAPLAAALRDGPGRQMVPAGAPGITASKIHLGVMAPGGFAEASEEVGFTAISGGDPHGEALAVIRWINRNGGLAGREVIPVFHDTDLNRGTWEEHAQQACSRWTEDNEIFAATAAGFDRDVLVHCLSKRNVILLKRGQLLYDRDFLANYRSTLYEPNWIHGDRWGTYVDTLHKEQFFLKDARVGILLLDTPENERVVEKSLKPRLSAVGITVADQVAIRPHTSTADVGRLGAEAANAVLRFRSAGVDHVLFASDPSVPLVFMLAAENQGYRPRYGLNSNHTTYLLASNVPSSQLRGSVGVGWQPTRDVDFADDPGGNDTRSFCMEIFKAAGVTFGDRDAQTHALSYCDHLLFLKVATHHADELSPIGIRATIDREKMAGYNSPLAFATEFRAGWNDGGAAVRAFKYVLECSCFRYSGPMRPVA